MWQTKYASAVPKNLGVGVNFGRAVKVISSPGVRSPWVKRWSEAMDLLQTIFKTNIFLLRIFQNYVIKG